VTAASTAGLQAEYTALRESCGLLVRPSVSVISVIGEDRQRLLNGLVTCDVLALEPGRGTFGFFTDVKGHVLADVAVRATSDRLWLELPDSSIVDMAQHIEKYIVADRVEVLVPEAFGLLTLLGPRAGEVAAELAGSQPLPAGPWDLEEAVIEGHEAVISAEGRYGVPAVSFWMSPSVAGDLSKTLLDMADPGDLSRVGGEAVEVVRVEEGMPVFGRDYGEENLPQETGLDDAVSYSKGCYLGQEVVARLEHRGQVARRVTRLSFPPGEPPAVGCALLMEERDAGRVTSVVPSPVGQQGTALAMLQRRALEPGTKLQLETGGSVLVV